MAPKAQQQFREGDVVWALDSGRYYKARVLAAEKAGSTYVHCIAIPLAMAMAMAFVG